MKVLALDFDGVVCDSLREVLATALATYEVMVPDSPLTGALRARHGSGRWHTFDLANDPVRQPFEAMMPLGNRAEDFGVSLVAIDRGAEIADQDDYDTFSATLEPGWADDFHREFYDQRSRARTADPDGWVALHAPYPEFLELLRRRAADTRLALATAKDRDSACRLLDHLGIGDLFTPDLVLDKEAGRSKTAHLQAVRDRTGVDLTDLTFVDDKVNHLERVAPLGVRCVLAGWGFNSEREHRRAHELGFAVANIADAESVLFDGG
ncbi:MAG: HAD family hydrolase [Holophagae bacterium]|jgi:phosphoglycolate phosphatase-like HAD superfamily hydrolase